MKLCKDCKHVRGDYILIESKCKIGYKCPVHGLIVNVDCYRARSMECYCGAEAKHFEAKEEEYVTLDVLWKEWEAAGVSKEDFKDRFARICEILTGSTWTRLSGIIWNFTNPYNCYRVKKSEIPPMPELVIPKCPHCRSSGVVDFYNEDGWCWHCISPSCDFCMPYAQTKREAIAMFHKYIKGE